VATQRAIPGWARGRTNAAVIMISQGAMALGGLIWGSAATIPGPSSALLGAATLFLTSQLLSASAFDQRYNKLSREGLRVPVWKCRT